MPRENLRARGAEGALVGETARWRGKGGGGGGEGRTVSSKKAVYVDQRMSVSIIIADPVPVPGTSGSRTSDAPAIITPGPHNAPRAYLPRQQNKARKIWPWCPVVH